MTQQIKLPSEKFGICVNDGTETLSDLTSSLNVNGLTLREWQVRATDYFFDNDNNVLFECATGTGKTFFTINLIKTIWKSDPEAKFLIIVPKNVILEQGWYTELKDAGIPIQDIGLYYGAYKEYSKVTITNMQSVNSMTLEIFDGIIYDECHNYLTKTMLPILKHKTKYRIGLSATIERADNKHWNLIKYFDYHKFQYTPAEALSDGVLNPFVFTNIGVEMDYENFSKYERMTAEINLIYKIHGPYLTIMRSGNNKVKKNLLTKLTERKRLVNNYYGKFQAVREIIKNHKDEKTLVFNEFNEQTNKLYWELLDINVRSKVFHSAIPPETRDDVLKGFKDGDFEVLLATKTLDEGYNLPLIEVGIIMAGNSSPRQTIQRMGRVLRKKETPSKLYQIYVKRTIEEEQANERAKMFKELALQYFER